MFTATREIDGKLYEGMISLFPGETDVYNLYVKGPENEQGEREYFFYSPEQTVESETRMNAPLGGTHGFQNSETSEALDGLFSSI